MGENEFKKLGNKKDFEQYWMMIDYFACYYTFIFLVHAPITFKSDPVCNMHSHDDRIFCVYKIFSSSPQQLNSLEKSSACLAKYLSNGGREVW
jgi:hypothetical protein